MTLTNIHAFVTVPGRGRNHPEIYVRLAYKYGVPFGRIVSLTGLSSDVVSAHLEGEG